jgi:hypothetical protein
MNNNNNQHLVDKIPGTMQYLALGSRDTGGVFHEINLVNKQDTVKPANYSQGRDIYSILFENYGSSCAFADVAGWLFHLLFDGSACWSTFQLVSW